MFFSAIKPVFALMSVLSLAAGTSASDPPSPESSRPVSIVIQVREDATLPRVFRPFVSDADKKYINDRDERQLELFTNNPEILRQVIAAPEIKAIEIARPSVAETLPPMVSAYNANARKSHYLDDYLGTFLRPDRTPYDGRSIRIGLFDLGAVLASHIEFLRDPTRQDTSRIIVDTPLPVDKHATHVAGTLAAMGRDPEVKGMAPDSTVLSEDAITDLNRLNAIAGRISISNHSYGPVCGWNRDETQFNGAWTWRGDKTVSADRDLRFGKYTTDEQFLDKILYAHPNLLTFVAAGNDRDDAPLAQPVEHFDFEVDESEIGQPSRRARPRRAEPSPSRKIVPKLRIDEHPRDAGSSGLETIAGLGIAKNAISVGAVGNFTPGAELAVESFSSYGPTADGRIKPDLVACGFRLRSTSEARDYAYVEMSGTSQASPAAAGIAALLVEQFRDERKHTPRAATIKAIMIHTATDAGAAGPDPRFGWGSINALEAGTAIAHRDAYLTDSLTIQPDSVRVIPLLSVGGRVRVTVVWTDPPGTRHDPQLLDDRRSVLVNDLDIKLIDQNGEEYFPYSLASDPLEQATATGPNHLDNVEVIDAKPLAGSWTLYVTAGPLEDGKAQEYAIVTSGLRSP